MKELFVFKSFKTVADAQAAANHLVDLGVPRQAITLGAERDISSDTTSDFNVVNGSDLANADDKETTSLWDRIVGIFQSEEAASEAEIDFDGYRSALALGDILILVEEEFHLMIDNTVEVRSAQDSQIPTEANERLEHGGSFASEDLDNHAPNDLAAPLKEIGNDHL